MGNVIAFWILYLQNLSKGLKKAQFSKVPKPCYNNL